MDELHALLTPLCLLVIYAFFHGVFITILTHHTILDRFRVRDDFTLRQELGMLDELWLGYLRCVLLLLILDVVM